MEPDLAQRAFRIGSCEIHAGRCVVLRDDQEHKISPRAMDVLIHLAQQPSEVVTTDDLLARHWRGDISLSNAAYKTITELRNALGDNPSHPKYHETVPKRG